MVNILTNIAAWAFRVSCINHCVPLQRSLSQRCCHQTKLHRQQVYLQTASFHLGLQSSAIWKPCNSLINVEHVAEPGHGSASRAMQLLHNTHTSGVSPSAAMFVKACVVLKLVCLARSTCICASVELLSGRSALYETTAPNKIRLCHYTVKDLEVGIIMDSWHARYLWLRRGEMSSAQLASEGGNHAPRE